MIAESSTQAHGLPPTVTQIYAKLPAQEIKVAWFKDSEGNLISLAEFPSGSPFAR